MSSEPLAFAAALISSWQQAVVIGTWFGLLHAFDADHLATIGGLALNDRSLSPAAYALRWAMGHGAALGAIALLVIGLGASRVTEWASFAEIVVCVTLLALGAQALRAVWHRRSNRLAPQLAARHLRWHSHAHAHTHARGRSKSVAMGIVHGTAGSGAALALLPLAHFRGGAVSILYVLFFSFGVALGALAFAKVFGLLAQRSRGEKFANALQAVVGTFAIGSAALLLLEIVRGGG